ncbi:MAG: hypothetical protein HY288_13735 [Planctomycetia bacterium]|nr:hypothetical protein [Planctomycetia bacterium]
MPKVSNEKKNLHRLAGEFLVASRLTQRGYMITLQWGNTISYDILAFDKKGNVAFLEVKSAAAHARRWVLQKKYANPKSDSIPLKKRFICCVDLAVRQEEPHVYVFPASVVAKGLDYYFNGRFPNSDSYHLSLDFRPQGRTKIPGVQTVGERIDADFYLEKYDAFGIDPILH